jgi:hypothetical protein
VFSMCSCVGTFADGPPFHRMSTVPRICGGYLTQTCSSSYPARCGTRERSGHYAKLKPPITIVLRLISIASGTFCVFYRLLLDTGPGILDYVEGLTV